MTTEVKFDLSGTKKTKESVANTAFESNKELIKAELQAKIANIRAEGVKVINEHQTNPEIVNSVREQINEKIQDIEAEQNLKLKALCEKHNRTIEKLESAEQIGMMVAKKVQSGLLDSKVGRATRGFISGICKGWTRS